MKRFALRSVMMPGTRVRAARALSTFLNEVSCNIAARPFRALLVGVGVAVTLLVSMAGSAGKSLEAPGGFSRSARFVRTSVPWKAPRSASAALAVPPDLAGASPFALSGRLSSNVRAQTCLAQAIYYEAGSEGTDGQRAVAQVVLNRVRHPLFPDTICGVVFQGASRDTGCQFTFTCDGSLRRQPSPRGWRHAWAIAGEALNGSVFPKVGYATHYHASWMLPYWASSVDRIAVVGGHIFYTWKGFLGQGGSFRQAYAGYEPTENFAVVSDPAKSAINAEEGPEPIVSVAAAPVKLDEGAADKIDRFGLLDFRDRSFESPVASADAREVDQALSNALTR